MLQPRASKACTSCRSLKVRCNGEQPCKECSHLALPCTFSPRRKSSRANAKPRSVISKLRNSPSGPPRVLAPSLCKISGIGVDDEFLRGLLSNYWTYIYVICPLLYVDDIEDSILRRGSEAHHAAFCNAYAAVSLALGGGGRDGTTGLIKELISQASQLCPVVTNPSQMDLKRIILSVYLRMACGVVQDYDMELFYHRESITMLQIAGSRMSSSGVKEVWQRLHWVIFIFEQLSAIAHNKLSIIEPPDVDPPQDEGMPDSTHVAFTRVSQLYRLVNEEFLRFWRDRGTSHSPTLEWVVAKQEAFDQQRKLVEEACPFIGPFHRADLVLSCQWLRLLVWQMTARTYLLRSDAMQSYLQLYFPVQESVYLKDTLRELDREPRRVGVGFVKKLFEVVDAASDVLEVSAKLPLPEDVNKVREWLENTCYLISYIQEFGRLTDFQKTLLNYKLDTLMSTVPNFP